MMHHPDLFPETLVLTNINYKREDFFYCCKCKTDKHRDEFYPSSIKFMEESKRGDISMGSATYCKACKLSYEKAKRDARNLAPSKPVLPSPCDCCGNLTAPDQLMLDHDHTTGKFRGWLCRGCNTGLGALGDDIKGLEQALAYLKAHYD